MQRVGFEWNYWNSHITRKLWWCGVYASYSLFVEAVFEWNLSKIRFPLEMQCPVVLNETRQCESMVRVERRILLLEYLYLYIYNMETYSIGK